MNQSSAPRNAGSLKRVCHNTQTAATAVPVTLSGGNRKQNGREGRKPRSETAVYLSIWTATQADWASSLHVERVWLTLIPLGQQKIISDAMLENWNETHWFIPSYCQHPQTNHF